MSDFSDEPSSPGRIAPRYQFEARVAIQFRDGDRMAITEGWARDLSESGLGAFVARGLSVGEQVTLVIPLTGSVRLVVPAQVIACVGTRYGFRFTALSAEQRTQIQSALRQEPRIPYPAAPGS